MFLVLWQLQVNNIKEATGGGGAGKTITVDATVNLAVVQLLWHGTSRFWNNLWCTTGPEHCASVFSTITASQLVEAEP